jgi:uncharacterized membrane protein
MTVIMFIAFFILKPMEIICEIFAHFDYTSRRVEWKKWLLGVPAAIVMAGMMLFVAVVAIEMNNNSGFAAFAAIGNGVRELWQNGAMKEMTVNVLRVAAGLLGFKLFALAFPYITYALIEVYRAAMRNAKLY